jgi:hypothetical protein
MPSDEDSLVPPDHEPTRPYERLYPKLSPEQIEGSLEAFKKLQAQDELEKAHRTKPFLVPKRK